MDKKITFTVSNKVFASVISKMAPAVGSRKVGTTVIENCIRLSLMSPEKMKQKKIATATIYDGSKQIFAPFELEENDAKKETTIYVNSSKLISLAKAFDGYDETVITFEIDSQLFCKCAGSEVKLELAEGTPLFDTGSQKKIFDFSIKTEKFKELVANTGYCYGDYGVFKSLCLMIKEGSLSLLSTNSHKAALQETKQVSCKKKEESILLLDGACLCSIIKLFDNADLKINVNPSYVSISDNLTGVILPLDEGSYPHQQFKDLLQSINKNKITLSIIDLKMALSIIGIVEDAVICFSEEEGALLLSSKSAKYKIEETQFEVEDKKWEIYFSLQYLKEISSHLKGTIELIFENPRSPVIFKEKENKELLTLLTPMKFD